MSTAIIKAGQRERHLTICFDGTHGNLLYMSDQDYLEAFKGSHVSTVAEGARKRFGAEQTLYLPGPHAPGTAFSVDLKLLGALAFIEKHARSAPNDRIVLHFYGYSRGGAMALDMANGFAMPPDGFFSLMAKRLSWGRTSLLVERFDTVRRALAGRVAVGTLVMFDAVDMSFALDGDPVAAGIGRVAHVVRSQRWGSRNGWRNCGTELAAGSRRAGFPVEEIDGTHAALGGLPGTGDLPKPLAKELLSLHPGKIDWQAAERVYRGMVPHRMQVEAAVCTPGLYVNWNNGAMLDAAAKRVVEFSAPYRPGHHQTTPALHPSIIAQGKSKPLPETLRAALKDYYWDAGGGRGLFHLKHDKALQFGDVASSFESIGIYFALDQNPAASRLIAEYRRLERVASAQTLEKIRALAGEGFPA